MKMEETLEKPENTSLGMFILCLFSLLVFAILFSCPFWHSGQLSALNYVK